MYIYIHISIYLYIYIYICMLCMYIHICICMCKHHITYIYIRENIGSDQSFILNLTNIDKTKSSVGLTYIYHITYTYIQLHTDI